MKQAWFVLGALVLFGAGAIAEKVAQPAQFNREVRADRFLLVDHDGKIRAELAMDRTGEPNLALYDTRGRVIWSARGAGIVPAREP